MANRLRDTRTLRSAYREEIRSYDIPIFLNNIYMRWRAG